MANSNQNASIKLPILQGSDPVFNRYQTQLQQALNPLTTPPMAVSTILTSQSLSAGSNTIQTGLGYPLTGWYIIRQRGQAAIWDSQDSNSNKNNTLILNASAAVSVDLVVF